MSAISIIIPVYNAEQYIARCLDSVLRQSFADYEVILVNDGSKDNSLALCEQYCRSDPRFRILDKQNGGAASARNLGLNWFYQNSDSEWLCFLDIDDFVHPRYLELLLAAAQEQQTPISMCSYEVSYQDALTADEIPTASVPVDTETLWCERQINCTIPWAKLFRRSLFCDVRFPEGIIHEDEFTLYRVLFQCKQIAFLDAPLYGYYQTETSVMRGAWTPRHMKEPEGLEAQLRFFRENGYQKAAAYTAKIYLLSIYNNLLRCRAAGKQYREYAAALKKLLGRELRQYKALAGVSMDEEPWLFYEAFPVGSIPHRLWEKLAKKYR